MVYNLLPRILTSIKAMTTKPWLQIDLDKRIWLSTLLVWDVTFVYFTGQKLWNMTFYISKTINARRWMFSVEEDHTTGKKINIYLFIFFFRSCNLLTSQYLNFCISYRLDVLTLAKEKKQFFFYFSHFPQFAPQKTLEPGISCVAKIKLMNFILIVTLSCDPSFYWNFNAE